MYVRTGTLSSIQSAVSQGEVFWLRLAHSGSFGCPCAPASHCQPGESIQVPLPGSLSGSVGSSKVSWHMEPGRVSHFPGFVTSPGCSLGLPLGPSFLKRKVQKHFCLSAGSVNQVLMGKRFIFCRNGDPRFNFAWGILAWPLRKGVPLPWAGSQQPLIKLQPCIVWHSLLTATHSPWGSHPAGFGMIPAQSWCIVCL